MTPDLPRGRVLPKRRFATIRTVMALILREMATRYGRSPGGYAWALLEPIGGVLILTLAFSLIFRSPPLGNSFVLFYATGFLPFQVYQAVSIVVARSILFSRPLLFYPAVTWADAVIARFLLNALTNILVMFIVFSGILMLQDTRILLDVEDLMAATGLALLLGLGVGMLNCVLMGLIRVWDQIWSILTRPLFIASGVFFTYDDLPRFAQEIIWYNPLIHVVGLMRAGFYPSYTASYVSVTYAASFGLIALFFGAVTMTRFHRYILNEG